MSSILLDTGPLVAYLNRADQHHVWAVKQFETLIEPVVTCEPVWAEAVYLAMKRGSDAGALWRFLRSRVIELTFSLKSDYESVAALMRRYADVPMSLADACVVRMSELQVECQVFTTDSHFKIYRRFGRQVIPLLSPH